MAHFTFKLTLEHANEMAFHGRRLDYRPKDKNVKVGDTITYQTIHDMSEVDHPNNYKTYIVSHKDGNDPRVMKDYDALCLTEFEPRWE